MMCVGMLFVLSMYGSDRRDDIHRAVVRVKVTSQAYDIFRPWDKQTPYSREGIGAIIDKEHVLVTATLVENHTYVLLESIRDKNQSPATIVQVDYSANLALLKPERPDFLAGAKIIPVEKKPNQIGDRLEVWQFESSGMSLIADAELKLIEVNGYPYADNPHLVYKVKVLLSAVGGGQTLPAVRRGRLVGLMMSHNQGNQTMTLIPAPVITHFLKDLNDGHYDGFPLAGFSYSVLEDGQLRRYLGVTGNEYGVFIDYIRNASPAAEAGLEKGDVLLAINGIMIDKNGHFQDAQFGKQRISHFISNHCYVGDTIGLLILRDKTERRLTMRMRSLPVQEYPVPPYMVDTAPKYMIVGGMVLQELTRPYLMRWNNWQTSAPSLLLYYERHQWDDIAPDNKLVFLSNIITSEGNIGYESLAFLPMTRINDVPLSCLEDVPKALEQPSAGLHKIEFEYEPYVIYFDATTFEAENKRIQQRYNLPALARLTSGEQPQ